MTCAVRWLYLSLNLDAVVRTLPPTFGVALPLVAPGFTFGLASCAALSCVASEPCPAGLTS
eukprot:12564568-Alexandrium_andersonii.AAC.1